MSFLKFWGKKSKAKDDFDLRKEETDAEAEKRKLRHSLSISRSGRFKQKKRERGGILDRPELYGRDAEGDYKEHSACSETSSSASTTSTNSATSNTSSSSSRPPHFVSAPARPQGQGQGYRDARHQGNVRAGHYMAT